MCEQMQFPKTFKEFADSYGFKDDKWAYTNGAKLIPVFRVEQWLNHSNVLPTIKKIKKEIRRKQWYLGVDNANQIIDLINEMITEKSQIIFDAKDLVNQINQLCSIELENGNGTKDEFIRKDFVLEIIESITRISN